MKRQSFIKLLPRRFTPDSQISSIGGNQYTTQWVSVKPEKVYQDRGGQSATDLGSFSWNESTKTLTFTTTSAPNENIFIDYPLRFCTSTVEYVQENPAAPSGSVVKWEPRLASHPSVSESASDMLNGVLSTASTSISLDNNDYGLNQYLTKYDNYKNKRAVIYGQIGDTYKQLAFGYITSTRSGARVTVSIKSSTKLLEAAATLNNREKYYRYTRSHIPALPDELEGKPIPVCYGPTSQVMPRARSQFVYSSEVPAGRADKSFRLAPDSVLRKAHYLGNYTFLLGISDNPWSRGSAQTVPISYQSSTTFAGNPVKIYSVSKDYIGYFIEGIIWLATRGGTDHSYIFIYHIDYANNNIWISTAWTNLIGATMVASQMFRREPPREDPSAPSYSLNEQLDSLSHLTVGFFEPDGSGLHKWTFEQTDSGQYLLYFTYGASEHAWFDSQGYGEFEHYFVLQSQNIGHSTFLKKYIESTGSSVDTASFSQAQSDANTNVLYTVNNEKKIESVHKVVENISTSCNGILYYDTETDSYKYKIVDSGLPGTDWTVSSRDILEADIVPSISYGDTANTIRMDHPYADSEGVSFIDGNNSSRISSFSRTFNAEEKVKTLSHYLTDSSVVIDKKSETFNTPMVTYRFTVMADKFFDVDIGDIIQIENVDGRLLSIGASIRLLVVSRKRSVEKIELVGYEFQKIS